ncbi:EamA-like transporter family OS=Afipia felis OX=1035 GN=NCTC12722_00603 PE=4 SV=1 [Afipia felis]
MSLTSLWIPFTLIGAVGQVARNAMQRGLTKPLGTLGATHIRFLFGFPFATVFLVLILSVTGDRISWPAPGFVPWLLAGSLAQIAGTALMLAAMNEHSFVVTTAYLKTEAIQAAAFGFVFLSDHLTGWKLAGMVVATLGVVLTALRPGARGFGSLRPTLLGLFAASALALSAVGYRGAILNVEGVSFVTAASLTLAVALLLQTLVLSAYLVARKPGVMTAIFRLWKPSMFAGFMGAFASLFWFLAFALTPAANVRTLALVEVLFAQVAAHYGMKQSITKREFAGIVLILIGVGALVAG